MQPLATNSATERVEVLDATGARIFGAKLVDRDTLAYASIVDDADRTGWESVQRVLARTTDERGDKFSEIVETPDGAVVYTRGK